MARKKGKIGDAFRNLTTRARATASGIYDHAGAFLMRAVCDSLAATIRELADYVDELDGENSRLKWDLTQAENLINDLEKQLLPADEPPWSDSEDSTNNLTGGQQLE